jgi:hypothetical protein
MAISSECPKFGFCGACFFPDLDGLKNNPKMKQNWF